MDDTDRNKSGANDFSSRRPGDVHIPAELRARFKAAIVTLALWGLIPAGLASWLINRAGPRHD